MVKENGATARLVCRASPTLDARLRQAAKRIGMTESNFMRSAIEEKIDRVEQEMTKDERPTSNPEPAE